MRKLILSVAMVLVCACAEAKDLVILHTNDTHSLIEPGSDGMGGILQRKAIIDSVRKAEKNVLLVDAGDIVQGTLYFKYFKGDVEYPLMNMAGYDIRILGNHEFDNGLEELAKHYKDVKGARLATNYDFSETPLKGMFEPYVIKKIDGKKIGFMGINIDPESLIAKENYEGLVYKDAISEANKTAELLKKKGCDLIVAVTHVGYENKNGKVTDADLARASKDIDIIIGGHSHTLVRPEDTSKPHIFKNAEGKPVLVVQTGKSGRYLGYIKVDLDDLDKDDAEDFEYRLLPVTDRFAETSLDSRMADFIKPYKEMVDSVNSRVIAQALTDMSNEERTGRFPNWLGDFAVWYGKIAADSLKQAGKDIGMPDFAIMNVGGIRGAVKKGDVTEGLILSIFPFSNRMAIVRLKGKDLLDVLSVAARKGGESVSREVRVVSNNDGSMLKGFVNLEEINPEKDYNVVTIDYLAQGNDDLTGMAEGEVLWSDSEQMAARILKYINLLDSAGLPISSDDTPRFITVSR